MSDNTILNTGAGGDVIRNVSRNGVKTQVIQIDLGSTNTEALLGIGQHLMATSMPVTLAYDQPALSVMVVPAATLWGQALSVTTTSTATIVNILTSISNYKIKGFICHGLGDGYFFVQVNGATVLSTRTRASFPVANIILPNGIAVPANSQITLKVTNESGSTSDYEGTLLGE